MTTIKETIETWLTGIELLVEKLNNDDFELDSDSKEELFKHMNDISKDIIYLYGIQELDKRNISSSLFRRYFIYYNRKEVMKYDKRKKTKRRGIKTA